MTKSIKLNSLLLLPALVLLLSACHKNDSEFTRHFEIPEDLTISDPAFYPEDIVINHNLAFISGFGDGTIRYFNLGDEAPTATVFAEAEDGFAQRWGLTSQKDVLLSIVNNANFMGGENGPSKLIEYNIIDKTITNEWELPANTIGHTVSIVDGKYYVGDFANPRIIQVDPKTGDVNAEWFTSAEWDPSIDGNLGGMIYDNKGGFYAYLGFNLWYLPIKRGEPGELQKVSISGLSAEQINMDGISWDKKNKKLYYASNDAMNPENKGTVYQLEFTDNTTAKGSILMSDLDDSSGLWYSRSKDGEFLMVCESQFGALFGLKTFEGPFNIKVLPID